MANRQGKGFFLWQLQKVMAYYPTGSALGAWLRSYGIFWITLKVANLRYPYNQVGGNDKILKEYIDGLKSSGLMVGGWHWTEPDQISYQGDLIEERRQKLGLDFIDINAESPWKVGYGNARAAKVYLDKQHNGVVEISLCSYRYPTLHREFPWLAFLNHDKLDAVTPQVYWIGSHNPGDQLARSIQEYGDLTSRRYIPIASTFGAGSWLPTVTDLVEFMGSCRSNGIHTFGFYSLDWILDHPKETQGWMDAIGEGYAPPPPPPPSVPVLVQVSAGGHSLWTHTNPDTLESTRNGYLPDGLKVKVDEVRIVGGREWYRSGLNNWFAGWLTVKIDS